MRFSILIILKQNSLRGLFALVFGWGTPLSRLQCFGLASDIIAQKPGGAALAETKIRNTFFSQLFPVGP
jgi:hypothetical protein